MLPKTQNASMPMYPAFIRIEDPFVTALAKSHQAVSPVAQHLSTIQIEHILAVF
jgi:hypothetical protein